MPQAEHTSLNRWRPKRCASSESCWIRIDWKTMRFSWGPSVNVHDRFTAWPRPFLVGPTVAVVTSALYLPGGISSRGGVPSSLATSKGVSSVVLIVIVTSLLGPVRGEFGEVEVERDRDLLRHREPVLRSECGAPFGKKEAPRTRGRACAFTETAIFRDDAQILGEKEHRVGGIHHERARALV